MSIIGLDIGYCNTKAVKNDGATALFPSVIGTRTEGAFSLESGAGLQVELPDGATWLVGHEALARSKYTASRRDPSWVSGPEYQVLIAAALGSLYKRTCNVNIVTGLPLEHYRAQRAAMENALLGAHRFRLGDGNWQTVTVGEVKIVTQPYGAFLDCLLTANGKGYASDTLRRKRVGIVDIGGQTINLLTTEAMREVPEWTVGDGLGLLKALDDMARHIAQSYPGVTPKSHEVAQWVGNGMAQFEYRGRVEDLAPFVATHLAPLADLVLARMSEAWPEPGRLSAVILGGGGAVLLRELITRKASALYPPFMAPADPLWANASGYLKYGRAKWEA